MGKLQMKLIKSLLDENNINYKIIDCDPLYKDKFRSSQSDISYGIKSLLLKSEEGKFVLALVPADKKIDLKTLARIYGTKSLSLANSEDVLKKTGCEIGGCHPFGTLSKLMTYMDKSILKNEIIEFNAGLSNVTIQMNSKDLVNLISPKIEDFSTM